MPIMITAKGSTRPRVYAGAMPAMDLASCRPGKLPGMSAPQVIGVVGAGTMGSGIAQLAAQSGARTLLFDPVEGAAAAGAERARAGIAKLVEKGVLTDDAATVGARLEVVGALEELAPCELIIEAAPERLELKHELFAALSRDRARAPCWRPTPRRSRSPRSRAPPPIRRASSACTSSTRRR